MNEKIYTLNENGSLNGLEFRNIVHEKAILHSTVQCWIMNQDGDILIQRRAETKGNSAGKWDVSFGGHCSETSENDVILANIIKEGKEQGQGVAYLNDGTMIVIDGGNRHIGETKKVSVTSVLQTAAGRMIFAKTME